MHLELVCTTHWSLAAPWSLNINSLHLPTLPPDQSGSVREDEGEQVGDIEEDDDG